MRVMRTFSQQTVKKERIFEGTSKPSISQRKMTPASLYTHYIDMNAESVTFGKRVPIGA